MSRTSYITDDKANITQYDAYLPYSELLVDEHSSIEDLPYKFNGKQFDEETGLYYYGAIYWLTYHYYFLAYKNIEQKFQKDCMLSKIVFGMFAIAVICISIHINCWLSELYLIKWKSL